MSELIPQPTATDLLTNAHQILVRISVKTQTDEDGTYFARLTDPEILAHRLTDEDKMHVLEEMREEHELTDSWVYPKLDELIAGICSSTPNAKNLTYAEKRATLQEHVDHILGYSIKAKVFYADDASEALIHTESTVICVSLDGNTSESATSYSTGYEI